MLQAKREKSIYHTLNMLSVDVTKKCLVGEGWSPVFASSQVIKYDISLFPRDIFQLPSWFAVLHYIWTIYNVSFQIQDALQRATVDSKSQVGSIFQVLNTKESPPTYFRTNKFTSAFQEIVDAYGYESLFWQLCSAADLAKLTTFDLLLLLECYIMFIPRY